MYRRLSISESRSWIMYRRWSYLDRSFFFFFLSFLLFFFFFFSLDDESDELEFTSFAFFLFTGRTPTTRLSTWPARNNESTNKPIAALQLEQFSTHLDCSKGHFLWWKPGSTNHRMSSKFGTASCNGDGRNGLVVRCGLHTFYCILRVESLQCSTTNLLGPRWKQPW